jgi:hypothetical protein
MVDLPEFAATLALVTTPVKVRFDAALPCLSAKGQTAKTQRFPVEGFS